jgi:hypothetical protein
MKFNEIQCVLRVSCGCLASVLRVSCGCLAGVLRVSCGCLASVLRVSCECLASVLRVSAAKVEPQRLYVSQVGLQWYSLSYSIFHTRGFKSTA